MICTGASTFGPLASLDMEAWRQNCMGKLVAIGQLTSALANGKELTCLRPGGSITVTSGQAARTLNKMWPGLAANNAGLEAFVRNVAIDAPRGVRVNAVAPALVTETARKAGLPLENTVPAAEVAAKFVELAFSDASGEVVDAGAQQVFTKSHRAKA